MRTVLIFSLIVFAGLAIVFTMIKAEKQAPPRPQTVSDKTNDSNGLEITDLRVPEYYPPPNQTQMKSLLQAAKAQSLSNGFYLATEVKLQTFRTNGQIKWLAQTPQCVYDSTGHMAHSVGPLHMQTADGKLYNEGEGFLWRQANSILIISNHIHTVNRGGFTNLFMP